MSQPLYPNPNPSVQVPILQYKSEMPSNITSREVSYHIRSLIVSCILWTFLFILYYCTIEDEALDVSNPDSPNYDPVPNLGLEIVSFIFYIFYMVECCFAGTKKYLSNDMETKEAGQYINFLKTSNPSIVISVECYHMETRTRSVPYTDANGNMSTRLETYQEKVVTFREAENFVYSRIVDITGDTSGISRHHFTKLDLYKDFEFMDPQTEAVFNDQANRMYTRNVYRDKQINQHVTMELPEFMGRVLVVPDGQKLPMWLSPTWYWVSSLLTLSWFYRTWFEQISEGRDLLILKSIGL